MRNLFTIAIVLFLFALSCDAFAPGSLKARPVTNSDVFKATLGTEEDILRPNYEIEPLPIRIGHGFDIHRMAPLQEAGQPIVIGGVEITHKDQKVRRYFYNS
jgi:2C-methyl-D-erythritol 2,4-cyclodiphosphate synthase